MKRRKKNPRGSRYDRCLGEVKRASRARNAYAVCAKLKRRRKKNPATQVLPRTTAPAPKFFGKRMRYFLQIQKPRGTPLYYLGGNKFGAKGRAFFFNDVATATLVWRLMRVAYKRILGDYTSTVRVVR